MKNKRKKLTFPLLLLLLAAWLSLPAYAVQTGEVLVPGGQAVGILLECDGVLVSSLAEVPTDCGTAAPARDAGMQSGDRIISLNGEPIRCGTDFLAALERLDGSGVTLSFCRGDTEKSVEISPVRDIHGDWKLGLLLRSGINGLGTVTFWDPQTGLYGALGHGVSLPEEQARMSISGGRITSIDVTDVVKGFPGTPGELCGLPEEDVILGTVDKNTDVGIFGHAAALTEAKPLPVASEAEICTGEASILSTVDGEGVREYSAEIVRITHGGDDPRQMTIRITDPALLEMTGGIVQGMSGSPIVQNGKLVGAVTHVLVSDPSKGYGVSIENMLAAA